MKTILKLSKIILLLLFINSCKKDYNSGEIKIELTDVPPANAVFQQVNIEVKQVSINYEGAKSDMWLDLPTKAGIYDLLKLRNNIIVITPETNIPVGKINEIRLLIGDNNEVVIGGNSYYLKVAGAYASGIKIKVSRIINRNKNLMILLDFDPEKSIHQNAAGNYIMDPVIKVLKFSDY